MKDEELIQKLEKVKLPVVEVPSHRNRLKQALLDAGRLKKRSEDSQRLPARNQLKGGINNVINRIFTHQPVWKSALAGLIVVVIIGLAVALPLTLLGEKTVSAEQITANTILAASKVSSVKAELTMSGTLEISGGPQAGTYATSGTASSAVDYTNNKQFINIDMTVDMPVIGKQQQTNEMYLVDGWMYMKLNLPNGGAVWNKMKIPGMGSEFTRQTDLLKTAQKVTLVGSEKADGIDCYVLQIDTDVQKVKDWLAQSGMTSGLDLNALNSQTYNSMVFKQWIAKDSFLPIKTTEDVVTEILPGAGTTGSNVFDKETTSIHAEGKFTDHNKPVSIELPPEAQNAKEFPVKP
jgi:hypothetical protein